MNAPTLDTAVRRIRALAGPPEPPPDRELLARFRSTRDEAAFAALVARHGPAVLGVCRRLLGSHDADDAFQATFLVLARRAGSIRNPAALGCWLHGVAVRVSTRLKGRLARLPKTVDGIERSANPKDEVLWRDVRRVLDEEVNRLPDRLRLPVFLCYFEGKTRDEAAEALGWKLTTLRGRLEDGRLRLRTRLAIRGVELSAALLAVSAVEGLAVGESLTTSTLRAVTGAASPAVQSLARGIVATKTPLAVGTLLLAVGLGTTLLLYPGQAPGSGPKAPPPAKLADPPPAEPKKDADWGEAVEGVKARLRVAKTKLKAGDPLAFELDLRNDGTKTWTTTAIPYDCEVLVDDRRFVYRGPIDYKARVRDLKPGGELVPFVAATADGSWDCFTQAEGPGTTVPAATPFRLTPGKHRVRVAFPVSTTVRPVSNTVEIEVEAQPLDPVVRALALAADRIWVVPSPTKEKPVPGPRGVLKGPRIGNGIVADLRRLPADDPKKEWLVFLRADEEGKSSPDVKVLEPRWSVPFDAATAEGILQAIRPVEWGPEMFGLHVGLRARQTEVPAGGPVAAEVTIEAVGPPGGTLEQLRYNVYDYWPKVRFEVTTPNGTKWLLRKPEGAIKREDSPARITLRPGEAYVQAVRLDRWEASRAAPGEEGPVPNLFTTPGEYTVTCRWAPSLRDDDSWATSFTSKPIRIIVRAKDPLKPAWGEAVGGVRARVRLNKPAFKPGEPLAFAFDLKVEGDKTYEDGPIPMHCRIILDGDKYEYTAPLGYPTAIQKLEPGKEYAPYVKVETNQWWTHVVGQRSVPLTLTPGKHKLTVSYPLAGKVEPVSAPVEFEVTAAPGVGRLKDFEAHPERFHLALYRLTDRPPPDGLGDKLLLHVPEKADLPGGLDADNRPVGRDAWIVEGEAKQLIAALVADGFFDRAADGDKAPPAGKGFFLEVWQTGAWAGRLRLAYPWDEETVRRLPKLADCLYGRHPDLVKELLAPLTDTVPAWGEPALGLSARLIVPDPKKPVTLDLEVRNRGTRGVGFVGHAAWVEIEVDGVWYEYALKPVDYLSSELKPNSDPRRVHLKLDREWVRKPAALEKPLENRVPLDLKPGRHTVRAVYIFGPAGVMDGEPLHAMTPKVEIEVP